MRRTMLVAALALVLTGCSGKPSDNTDPRLGRVYTTYSNCATGSCVSDWKVCIGADLLVHVDGADPADHTVSASPECSR